MKATPSRRALFLLLFALVPSNVMAAPSADDGYQTVDVLDVLDTSCALIAIDDFYADLYAAPADEPVSDPMLDPMMDPMLEPTFDPMLEPTFDPIEPAFDPEPTLDPMSDPMLAYGSTCELEPPDSTLVSIPGLPTCIELEGGTLCIDAPEQSALADAAYELGLTPDDLGVTAAAPAWLFATIAFSTCALPPIVFEPPQMFVMAPVQDPHAAVKEYWAAVGKKPTCFKTNFLEAESRAFPKYRQQAAAAFNQILIDYLEGRLTLEQYKQKLGDWHVSYKQKYANCGERAKLVASIAAFHGYESYSCVRKNGDHEFPIIVMDGKLYIVEAWDDKPGGFEMTEVTARKDGKALTLPIADWTGVELVGTDGVVKETSGGCNVVLPKPKK